jgi:hypothetical protein
MAELHGLLHLLVVTLLEVTPIEMMQSPPQLLALHQLVGLFLLLVNYKIPDFVVELTGMNSLVPLNVITGQTLAVAL